jgi:GDP-D-mannose dehydratase
MSSSKKALVTGITGQDGSYLAELLLESIRAVNLSITHKFQTSKIEKILKN